MIKKRISALVMLATLIFWHDNAHSADFIFYCAPWKEINNKKFFKINFTIKIIISSLSILEGVLKKNFFKGI